MSEKLLRQTGTQISAQFIERGFNQIDGQIRDQFDNQIRDQIDERVCDQVFRQIDPLIAAQLKAQLKTDQLVLNPQLLAGAMEQMAL